MKQMQELQTNEFISDILKQQNIHNDELSNVQRKVRSNNKKKNKKNK